MPHKTQSTARNPKSHAGLALEELLWHAGWRAIAGVDEAGRGAWAGPVCAAAVILPREPASLAPLLGRVDDSKRLTPLARERLFEVIRTQARAIGIGSVPADEIDRIGIAAANRRAMVEAILALSTRPDFLVLDFLTLPELPIAQRGVPHGDALSLSIAAASIIAKVTRDRWMVSQEANYPGYGFDRHKGYGTAGHRASLERLGPCPIHRRSFAPVSALSAELHEAAK